MKNSEDVWCMSDEQISEIAINFYKNLFTSSHPTTTRSVLEAITPFVIAEMNEDLLKEFIREEVEATLKTHEASKGSWTGWYASLIFPIFLVCARWWIACSLQS